MPASPRIVLLHATPLAIEPIRAAFHTSWPEAQTVNLLDDSLSADRALEPGEDLSDAMFARFLALGRYARQIGADGVLATCSAFGPAIERMAQDLPVPVLKPNEAMFQTAFAHGARIGMLATFPASIPSMSAEFDTEAARQGQAAELVPVLVERAMALLAAGDGAGHDRLVAEAAPSLAECDAVMLAQFSTARAAPAVRARLDAPVLTAPEAAVARMRTLVAG